MKMKRKLDLKLIIIILGGIAAIMLMYMLIFLKKPIDIDIDIDSDNISKIDICISEPAEVETYYSLEISDRDIIEELVSEMNDIRARKVFEPIKTGDYADVSIRITIYAKKPSSHHFDITISGNGFISMYEGGEGNRYKMSDKRGAKFYKYVKNLCISDENCKIKHDMLEPW